MGVEVRGVSLLGWPLMLRAAGCRIQSPAASRTNAVAGVSTNTRACSTHSMVGQLQSEQTSLLLVFLQVPVPITTIAHNSTSSTAKPASVLRLLTYRSPKRDHLALNLLVGAIYYIVAT